MDLNLLQLYSALAPCVSTVLTEQYPQIAGAAGELVLIAGAASRLLAALRGTNAPPEAAGPGNVGGKLVSVLNLLGFNRK